MEGPNKIHQVFLVIFRKANQRFPRANLLGTRHGYGCAGQRGAKQFDEESPKKPIRDEETKTSPGFGLGVLWKKSKKNLYIYIYIHKQEPGFCQDYLLSQGFMKKIYFILTC